MTAKELIPVRFVPSTMLQHAEGAMTLTEMHLQQEREARLLPKSTQKKGFAAFIGRSRIFQAPTSQSSAQAATGFASKLRLPGWKA